MESKFIDFEGIINKEHTNCIAINLMIIEVNADHERKVTKIRLDKRQALQVMLELASAINGITEE